jgi:hypothetical protein
VRTADPDVTSPPARRWVAEAVLLVGVYTAYSFARNVLGSARVSFTTAATHAHDVLHLERLTGLDIELGLQRVFLDHAHWFVRVAGVYYRTLHQWALIVTLVWLLSRRTRAYPRLRTALLCATVLALLGFWLYPLAPPRLFPGLGFVDTVRLPVSRWSAPPDPSGWDFASMATNQFAAMPSLHLAWAVWIVVAAWSAGAGRLGRSLSVAHLVMTSLAVTVTANHWVLDGVAGAVLTALGLALASRLHDASRTTHREPAGRPRRGAKHRDTMFVGAWRVPR